MLSRRRPSLAALLLTTAMFATAGCENIDTEVNPEAFPITTHSLLPPDAGTDSEGAPIETRVSVGGVEQPVDEQPISFNHSIHAGTVDDGGMAMSCEYCHSNARESRHAGVPPVQVCEGCHKMVATDGRPELEKLKAYLTGGEKHGEPIPWIKVHDAPDFVHFNHSRHVKAGVECTDCHADMSKETVAVRDPEMTMLMGWCLDCHNTHPSVEANYGADAELRRAELKDCYTCHQ